MDIQTRKLNVINYLVNLDDERELKRIESEILKSKKYVERKLKPFTKKELLARAKQSIADYNEGMVYSQEEVEKESINW